MRWAGIEISEQRDWVCKVSPGGLGRSPPVPGVHWWWWVSVVISWNTHATNHFIKKDIRPTITQFLSTRSLSLCQSIIRFEFLGTCSLSSGLTLWIAFIIALCCCFSCYQYSWHGLRQGRGVLSSLSICLPKQIVINYIELLNPELSVVALSRLNYHITQVRSTGSNVRFGSRWNFFGKGSTWSCDKHSTSSSTLSTTYYHRHHHRHHPLTTWLSCLVLILPPNVSSARWNIAMYLCIHVSKPPFFQPTPLTPLCTMKHHHHQQQQFVLYVDIHSRSGSAISSTLQ